jgi:hypothetical protein
MDIPVMLTTIGHSSKGRFFAGWLWNFNYIQHYYKLFTDIEPAKRSRTTPSWVFCPKRANPPGVIKQKESVFLQSQKHG